MLKLGLVLNVSGRHSDEVGSIPAPASFFQYHTKMHDELHFRLNMPTNSSELIIFIWFDLKISHLGVTHFEKGLLF